MNIFVASARFCKWLREAVLNGDLDSLTTFADEITHTVTYILKMTDPGRQTTPE